MRNISLADALCAAVIKDMRFESATPLTSRCLNTVMLDEGAATELADPAWGCFYMTTSVGVRSAGDARPSRCIRPRRDALKKKFSKAYE